mmetsp:Transcript_18086/g.54080  ORF Transcript_18086/g.54080 Transcript_18086/m.54080 type:complete len:242 (+) Transcript_18086:526-1251(+)
MLSRAELPRPLPLCPTKLPLRLPLSRAVLLLHLPLRPVVRHPCSPPCSVPPALSSKCAVPAAAAARHPHHRGARWARRERGLRVVAAHRHLHDVVPVGAALVKRAVAAKRKRKLRVAEHAKRGRRWHRRRRVDERGRQQRHALHQRHRPVGRALQLGPQLRAAAYMLRLPCGVRQQRERSAAALQQCPRRVRRQQQSCALIARQQLHAQRGARCRAASTAAVCLPRPIAACSWPCLSHEPN